MGLETLTAESLTVTNRAMLKARADGCETSLLTIRREDKNEPLGLRRGSGACQNVNSPFLVNTQSGRAALAAPASSLTLEDGSIEERVRLIRPLSRDAVSKARLATSHWQVAAEAEFVGAWLKELAEIPPTRSSEIHLVTGLLLPVWKHLPRAASKVYRLQTDDGERIVGRLLAVTDVPNLRAAFNLDGGPALSAEDAHALLLTRPGTHSAAWRPGLARFDGDERQAHRTYRLSRYRSRAAQELRLLQRDHRLALAAVSARGFKRGYRSAIAAFSALPPAYGRR